MPEHISAYSLILEPGTRFARLQEAGELPALPDEDADRRMYHETRGFLVSRGYERYEISNYARPGRECRHNCGYWTGHPYLGFGIGAASCVDGVRFTNIDSLDDYCSRIEGAAYCTRPEAADDPGILEDAESCCNIEEAAQKGVIPAGLLFSGLRRDVHPLSTEEKMEEFMFLGLRMRGGISKQKFYSGFGKKIEDVYGAVLEKHLRQGVLEQTPDGFRLTERGIDVSNYVLADYLMD